MSLEMRRSVCKARGVMLAAGGATFVGSSERAFCPRCAERVERIGPSGGGPVARRRTVAG